MEDKARPDEPHRCRRRCWWGCGEVLKVRDDVCESVGLGIPAVEDVDDAIGVVGEVDHAGDEDAAVGGLGEEAGALDAGSGDSDVMVGGQR